MIGSHEMAVLRAVAAGEWRKGWSSGAIAAAAAEAARRKLVRAHLLRMCSSGPVLTERGHALLHPTPVQALPEYRPPAPLPTRAGAMAFAGLPSVCGSRT